LQSLSERVKVFKGLNQVESSTIRTKKFIDRLGREFERKKGNKGNQVETNNWIPMRQVINRNSKGRILNSFRN